MLHVSLAVNRSFQFGDDIGELIVVLLFFFFVVVFLMSVLFGFRRKRFEIGGGFIEYHLMLVLDEP
jgi:hypothetical protein